MVYKVPENSFHSAVSSTVLGKPLENYFMDLSLFEDLELEKVGDSEIKRNS